MDAKTVLLDVGDRRIDFQCLADRLAALSTQIVTLTSSDDEFEPAPVTFKQPFRTPFNWR